MYDDSVLKYNLCVQYITVYLYLWTVQNEPHSPEKPNTVYFEKCQLIWSFFVYNSCSPPSISCRCLYILCTTAVQSAQILVYFVWCVIIFLSVEKHLLGLDLCVCVCTFTLYTRKDGANLPQFHSFSFIILHGGWKKMQNFLHYDLDRNSVFHSHLSLGLGHECVLWELADFYQSSQCHSFRFYSTIKFWLLHGLEILLLLWWLLVCPYSLI